MFTRTIPVIKKGAGIFAAGVLTKLGHNTGQVIWDGGKSRFFPSHPATIPVASQPVSSSTGEIKSMEQPPTAGPK